MVTARRSCQKQVTDSTT